MARNAQVLDIVDVFDPDLPAGPNLVKQSPLGSEEGECGASMDQDQDSSDLVPTVASPLGLDTAIKLREGIRQVQIRFVWAVIICSAGIALCYPRLGDRPRTQALQDLAELDEHLDVQALSRTLVASAEQQTATDLQAFARILAVPRLNAVSGGRSANLFAADAPDLSSLETMARATTPAAEVILHGPAIEALASSLRWRLERSHKDEPLTLVQLRRSRSVSPQTVDLEARAAQARIAAAEALVAYEQAREKYLEKRDLSDLLIQRGASSRAKFSAARDRSVAYGQVEETTPAMRTTREEYERLARAARTSELSSFTGTSAGIGVVATLQTEGGGKIEYEIPLASTRLTATTSVPPPHALARLQRNRLWRKLKALSVETATAQLRRELSWHFRDTQVAGVRVHGVAALQIFPLILCFVMWHLTRRCRAVARVYSPFGFTGTDLTNPGTGRLSVDGALLIAPPALVFILTCLALLRLDAIPWIAAPLCIMTIIQSSMAVLAWRDLHGLCAGARHTNLVPSLPEHPVPTQSRPRVTPPPISRARS